MERVVGARLCGHVRSTVSGSDVYAYSCGPALLLCQGGARFGCVEDDACELSFEAADRFASAFAFGLFAFQVCACVRVVAGLRDRDSVEGGVELAVAAAFEPVALHAA